MGTEQRFSTKRLEQGTAGTSCRSEAMAHRFNPFQLEVRFSSQALTLGAHRESHTEQPMTPKHLALGPIRIGFALAALTLLLAGCHANGSATKSAATVAEPLRPRAQAPVEPPLARVTATPALEERVARFVALPDESGLVSDMVGHFAGLSPQQEPDHERYAPLRDKGVVAAAEQPFSTCCSNAGSRSIRARHFQMTYARYWTKRGPDDLPALRRPK